MILVADSGSSKTEWRFITEGKVIASARTIGYNPHHQTSNQILSSLQMELAPQMPPQAQISTIYFYGAGCSSPKSLAIVQEAFSQFFPHSTTVVDHDLLAAARALCKTEAGIACILGTGSSSCLYNGQEISGHVPALGFVLGDEGSGSHLGKRIVSDYLRGDMPEDLRTRFNQLYRLNTEEVLDRIYRKPLPKPYLASFTQFIGEHKHHAYCQEVLQDNFEEFLRINVLKYNGHQELPVHFVGSVAYHFHEELNKALQKLNLRLGTILQTPIDGLVKFHTV
jgi:N-acetylglucosamine kinase-like BadF-type ATPase